MEIETEDLLSVRQAAAFLGCSTGNLKHHLSTGHIAYFLCPDGLRYPLKMDVEHFAKTRRPRNVRRIIELRRPQLSR